MSGASEDEKGMIMSVGRRISYAGSISRSVGKTCKSLGRIRKNVGG